MGSLLAWQISLPAFIASMVGRMPIMPTRLTRTVSVFSHTAHSMSPSMPLTIFGILKCLSRFALSLSASSWAFSSSKIQQISGSNSSICSSIKSIFLSAARPRTLISLSDLTISRVCFPIEPVLPSTQRSMLSTLCEPSYQQQGVKYCRRRKKHRIEPVQYTAVSRDTASKILYSMVPLDG